MIPSVRASRRNASSASSSVAARTRRGPCRAGTRARARRPGSRGRRRSSGRPRSGRPRPRAPTTARRGGRRAGRCRGSPRPPPRHRRGHVRVLEEAGEEPDRVRAAADARDRPHPGSRPSASSTCARASRPITACSSRDDLRVRVRADARADQVVGRLDVRDPVADRLARRLLQRPRAELDRAHLGAEQVHPLDVRPLPAHVLGAHVDDALEAEARADGRGGDAVLAGARLGDDPPLAEPPREHRLAERVVQLVRARVQEVLALQVDPLAGREALGERQRRRAGRRTSRPQLVELGAERGVLRRCAPARLELVERRDQRLGDVAAAVRAVPAGHRAAADECAHARRGP